MTAVIEARAMSTGYSGQAVVHDLDLAVDGGEVVCLLGPNGAGKTTTMLALSGELPVLSGEVLLDGVPTTERLHERARKGMSFVTEERSVFKALTTRDNFRVANLDPNAACSLFPELEARMSVLGGLLSGGEQQMLTLARALARKPRILLADELSLGLAPQVVNDLFDALDRLRAESVTILLVDQMAGLALALADRAYVIDGGRIVADGPAAEIAADGALERAYLAVQPA